MPSPYRPRAVSYATSRVAMLEGPYGYCRLLAFDVRGVEAVVRYTPDRSTSLSQPRNAAPTKVNGRSAPILEKRAPLPLPARRGQYTMLREYRLDAADPISRHGRLRVAVRCDCGRESSMPRSTWLRPQGPRSCKPCSRARQAATMWGRSRVTDATR